MALINTLLSLTSQTGDVTGAWFSPVQSSNSGDAYVIMQATFKGGTATSVVIEGRVSSQSDPVLLQTFTATNADAVLRMPQMRARTVGASGFSVLVESPEAFR